MCSSDLGLRVAAVPREHEDAGARRITGLPVGGGMQVTGDFVAVTVKRDFRGLYWCVQDFLVAGATLKPTILASR